jgi:hypothetical protein
VYECVYDCMNVCIIVCVKICMNECMYATGVFMNVWLSDMDVCCVCTYDICICETVTMIGLDVIDGKWPDISV